MTFSVRIDPLAQREIDDFGIYTGAYSEEFAVEQFARLREIFSYDLGEHPLRSTFFALTGAPYRAYLFRVGQRTRYWIIYAADEDRRTVNVLRFWNASRDPDSLRLPADRDG